MAENQDIDQLEKDFRSGRNPLAYLPLCTALRRRGSLARALEVCREGLSSNASSTAGQTMHARILNDLHKHEEAARAADRALSAAPEAMGALIEKARALVALGQFNQIAPIIDKLQQLNPIDPQVKSLTSEYNRAVALGNAPSSGIMRVLKQEIEDSSPASVETHADLAQSISAEMKSICNVLSLAVVPIGAGEPSLAGELGIAEAAYSFFKGARTACEDLDAGQIGLGIVETERAILFVLVRRRHILTMATSPDVQFGKALYRLQQLADRYLGRTT